MRYLMIGSEDGNGEGETVGEKEIGSEAQKESLVEGVDALDEQIPALKFQLQDIISALSLLDLTSAPLTPSLSSLLPPIYLGTHRIDNLYEFRGNMRAGKPAGRGIIIGPKNSIYTGLSLTNTTRGQYYYYYPPPLKGNRGVQWKEYSHGVKRGKNGDNEYALVRLGNRYGIVQDVFTKNDSGEIAFEGRDNLMIIVDPSSSNAILRIGNIKQAHMINKYSS